MPIQPDLSSHTLSANATPTPCIITPALLKQHSITPDEYKRVEQHLGRTPSLTELGIFSVMWSEHCSYKSSRVHLKRLPTMGSRTTGPGSVVQGPGENAGIIDVGDGWACAFKIESHNHPSYIEPYQGAATGVGGILRDIFTMGARPLAIMDSLRFGPLAPPEPATKPGAPSSPTVSSSEKMGSEAPPNLIDTTDYAKNHQVANGVVHGVAGYGNCFGVPNLGGETRFEPCYSGNPLLNAFALGLVRKDEIFYAKATGVGNPVFYVGATTGRDGIHGATMASEEFTEGSEQKRPNVQMGDPFLEKLLLEACLEAMKTGAVLGIQDMGAAGLTCSTCEMGARGELGVSIELDLVPQRETGMTSYEIMLSESQERMLLVAQKGREQEVLDVFAKWGLDCAEVGVVTADDIMRVTHHGELVAEIPNKALTDNAPVYNRPVGVWQAPVPKDPPAWVLEELKKPRDYTADLLKLLASPNICDKRYIYEQYDSMVQTNTVQGPGFEAGIIRIKGTGAAHPSKPTTSEIHRQASNPVILSEAEEFQYFAGVNEQTEDHPSPPNPVIPTEGAAEVEGFASLEPFPDLSSRPERSAVEGPDSPVRTTLDPIAAEHSIAGKLLNLIAGSTPQGEATLATGNEDATNPVLAPDETHEPGAASVGAAGSSPLNSNTTNRGFTPGPFTGSAPGSSSTASKPKPGAPPSPTASPSERVGNRAAARSSFSEATPKPERGIAMALAGNGRWCYLDPKLGAMHAVAEAARKVACTGATPVAATNCLNFGNPEKPEIMAQLSAAIDGIAEACTALGTPITGGNVSLYNETRGEGIYPTPVIGVVGLLDDVTKAVPNSFQQIGDAVLVVIDELMFPWFRPKQQFGSTEFASTLLDTMWGEPPAFEKTFAAAMIERLSDVIRRGLIHSASDIGSGGLGVALCRASLPREIGTTVKAYWDTQPAESAWERTSPLNYFDETPALLLTCAEEDVQTVTSVFSALPQMTRCVRIGTTVGDSVRLQTSSWDSGEVPIADLRAAYSNTLESQLAAEVVTA